MIGGAVDRNERDAAARFWIVDDRRLLRWSCDGSPGGVTIPIPGTAVPICADPWGAPFVLLADGEAFRAVLRPGQTAWWNRTRFGLATTPITGRNTVTMTTRSNGPPPVLVGGHIERRQGTRRIVAWTHDRRALLMAEDAGAVQVGGPIPGTADVLHVHVEGDSATALLADGTLWLSTLRGWSQMGRIGPAEETEAGDAASLTRLVARRGFRLDRDRTVEKGQTFEAPAVRANELVRRGWAEPVTEPAP